MFIELTDHLRCPAEHAESYLVLIPDLMEGRRVVRGTLGCPVCRTQYRIVDGLARLGDRPAAQAVAGDLPTGLDADGALALLGLDGAGGFIALGGAGARLAPSVAAALPGVHCVAVNPPPEVQGGPSVSVLEAATWPLKARSMRGVLIGGSLAADPRWRDAAVGSVLPGLRATGTGEPPAGDLLAAAGGWWVLRGGTGAGSSPPG